jgi:hypothetical protein
VYVLQKLYTAILVCALPCAHAQYTAEWTSGNLGQYGYGGAYGYDIDNDGLVEYYVRQLNQITFYNGDYTVEWNISVPGYDYVTVISPRDIDGDGLFIPLNTDNDAAGEIIVTAYYYDTNNSTYYGKFRVYDAVTRVMEHESSQITGFYGTASQEDIDGDGRDEIILTRFGSTTSASYVDVYAYTGTGCNENAGYSLFSEVTSAPNPATQGTSVRFMIQTNDMNAPVRIIVYDAAGRAVKILMEMDHGVPGSYELLWDGKDETGVSVSSGTYFITVTKGGVNESRSVQIVR